MISNKQCCPQNKSNNTRSLTIHYIRVSIHLILDSRKQKKRRTKEDDQEEFNPDDDGEGGELEMVPGCAARNAEQEDEKALEDEYGAKDYRSQMQLKSDYMSRPLWVVRN